MKWLSKMEYKYGRRAPQRLMTVIAGGQIVVWLGMMLFNQLLPFYMTLERGAVLSGQIWRLLTFLFIPVDLSPNPLFFALAVYLIFWIGNSLENAWGSFKFDAYFLLGILGNWLVCLMLGAGSAMSIWYSFFFAFAYLYPDVQLMLFFIIPVKVKWLGVFAGALYALNILSSLITGQWRGALALLVAIVNFLIFFGPGSVHQIKRNMEQRRRRREWQKQWNNTYNR